MLLGFILKRIGALLDSESWLALQNVYKPWYQFPPDRLTFTGCRKTEHTFLSPEFPSVNRQFGPYLWGTFIAMRRFLPADRVVPHKNAPFRQITKGPRSLWSVHPTKTGLGLFSESLYPLLTRLRLFTMVTNLQVHAIMHLQR